MMSHTPRQIDIMHKYKFTMRFAPTVFEWGLGRPAAADASERATSSS